MLKGGGPRDSQSEGTVFHECLTRVSSQRGVTRIARLESRGEAARIENTESWRKRMIRGPIRIRRLEMQSARAPEH